MNFIHEPIHLGYDDLNVDNTPNGRFYITPEGKRYPSVTTVLGAGADMKWKDDWIARVGQAEADKVSRQATTRGTAVHTIIEKYLDNDPAFAKDQMPANMGSFYKIRKALDEGITKIFRQEAPLYSDMLRTAGRVDVVGQWRGIKSIIDFKTSKKNKLREDIQNYFMQESFYAYAFYERTGIIIPQLVTVITVDEGESQVFVEKTREWLPEFISLRNRVNL